MKRGMLIGPTIAEAMRGPRNGFALVRLALALAVVVSHAFSVTTGYLVSEPLLRQTGFTLGEHAVNGFFAVSGFLVTMSFARRGWRDYLVARLLRVAPGLAVAVLAVTFLLGAALTRLPVGEYLLSGTTWRFVWNTLTSFKSNAALPGLFADNPFTFPMGTVWTLKYEVICYAAVLAAGLAGLLARRWPVLAAAGAGVAMLLVVQFFAPDAPKGLQTVLRLPLIFAIGAALYLWRDRVRLSWAGLALAAVLTALASRSFLYEALLYASEAYGMICLALTPVLARPRLDPRHDLSYGTYLYGWPIQQALRQLFPDLPGLVLLGPSLALTLAAAAASWFLVERPALALKARSLGRRTIGTVEPAAP